MKQPVPDTEPSFSHEKFGQNITVNDYMICSPGRSSHPIIPISPSNYKSEPKRVLCSAEDLEKVKKNLLYISHELMNKDFLQKIKKTSVDFTHLHIDQQNLMQQGTLRNLINLSAVKIKDL